MTRRFVLLALVAVLSTACGQAAGGPGAAAVINDQTITTDTIRDLALEFIGQQPAGTAPSVDELAPRILGVISNNVLLAQELQELDPDAVDEQFLASARGPQSLQEFEEVASQIETGVLEALGDGIEVSPETVEQFIADLPPTVAHILVQTEAEADAVVARIDAGEDFAAVAAEVSIDPGSAAQGGLLGPLEPGQAPAAFDEAVAALQVGEVSGPVQTEFGVHVITVLPSDLPDDIMQQVEPLIRDQQVQEQYSELLQTSIQDADATVNPRFGTWELVVDETGGLQPVAAAGGPLGDLIPLVAQEVPEGDSLLPAPSGE